MKAFISYILIFIFSFCLDDFQSEDFKKILAEFPVANLPYNTISSNAIQEQKSIRKRIITKDLCVKFLLRNDESKAWYFFQNYDYETGKTLNEEKRLYAFHSIFSIEVKPFYILVYQKSSVDGKEVYLSIFNAKGEMKGELLIGAINGDSELDKFVKSTVSQDQKIEIDMFKAIPVNEDKSRYDTTNSRTVVTHLSYKINPKIGRIEFVDSVRQFSKCEVDDFFANKSKCKISKFK